MKGLILWLSYAVMFSTVIGFAIGQPKPSEPVQIYQELIE